MISFQVFGIETINRGAGRVNRLHENMKQSPRTIIRRAGESLLVAMKEACPYDDTKEDGDHARDLIEFHIHGGDEGSFEGPYYLQYVIGGADPHPIDAAEGSGLAFVMGGESFVRKHVDHPGNQPNDFRKEAWANAREEVQSIVHEVGMKLVQGESEVE